MSLTILRKLRGRSAAELVDRSRQGLGRMLERLGVGDIGEPSAGLLGAMADGEITGPFFPSVESRDATLEALNEVSPDSIATLRRRADKALSGRFDLLGHRDVSFGDPIDWHFEPMARVRSPMSHWSRINYLDPLVAGDHKLLWELSRHQHLVTLAQAWWCTRDERYASAVERTLVSWMDANPPKSGVHWASSLEASFRAIAWTWVLHLTADVLPADVRRRALSILAISGRHIARYLSTWFSPNTHLTGEALGLFVLGTALPGLRDSPDFQSVGRRILMEWLPRHVRPDGTYVEQSTWYHRYTTDFYLHFAILAGVAGKKAGDEVRQALGGLLEFLAWMTRPDGTMPLVGDDDGGRLLFLDEGTAHRTGTPLAVGAVLLNRADLAAVAGNPTAELVWLLGPEGLARFRQLSGSPPAGHGRAFRDGGMYVMRSGWDGAAGHLTIDAGPHGFLNGGHAHADALSLDLAVGGRSLFVDPGTFTYTTSLEWRDHFRSGAAHNAVTVDGCGVARMAGPFGWVLGVGAECEAWYEGDDVVLFQGVVGSYGGLMPSVGHLRSVVHAVPDLWVIQDELMGQGEHELAVHWQCAPDVQPVLDVTGARLRRSGMPDVRIVVAESGGDWSIEEGWVSPTYGVRLPAPRLKYVRRGRLPLRITTAIGWNVVSASPSPEDSGVTVAWGERRGTLYATGSRYPAWLVADARLLWAEGHNRVVAAGVRKLEVGGRRILDASAEVPGVSFHAEVGAAG